MELQFSPDDVSRIRGLHQSMTSALESLQQIAPVLPFIMLVLLFERQIKEHKNLLALHELCGSTSTPDQERAI